ncbi:hypothetical protein BDSB_01155 [Burkholderia dolosa PC543]|nr:hypothetical protein BDSB_01155 [Burkholderia dolosa PC543]
MKLGAAMSSLFSARRMAACCPSNDASASLKAEVPPTSADR